MSFSEPVAAFRKSTPSIEGGCGTIFAVSSHSEQGVENGYPLFITPDGDGDVTVTLVAAEECGAGICAAGGTRLDDLPAGHMIAGPAETAAGKLSVTAIAAMPPRHFAAVRFRTPGRLPHTSFLLPGTRAPPASTHLEHRLRLSPVEHIRIRTVLKRPNLFFHVV